MTRAPRHDTFPAHRVVMVIVTGSGRSGTSSLAGSLKRLGLYVPQPEVPAKPTNPRGFYEPQWVIDFHKRHLRQLSLHNIDSRPRAREQLGALLSDGTASEELRVWLIEHMNRHQIVIKDPQAYWFSDLWSRVTKDLGIDLRYLTCIRHPAEVVGSRDIAYRQDKPPELRRTKDIANAAGWINSVFLTELAGREHPRAFVRYTDLITDWRSTLERARRQLSLEFNADLTDGRPHEVDDYLDAGMRHSGMTWDDIGVPKRLRLMGEEVWQLVNALVHEPNQPRISGRLDELHDDYVVMYEEALALTFDHSRAESVLAVRDATQRYRRQTTKLRRELKAERAKVRELETSLAKAGADAESMRLRSKLGRLWMWSRSDPTDGRD